jgi:calreticulin
LLASAAATVFFNEEFDAGWEDRWVVSEHADDLGTFVASHGKFYDDEERDVGLQTSEDAKFYAISRTYDSFSNKDKTLVLQLTVKHEQGIDCGGGYIKIGPSGLDQANFNGESEYNIMFGPDVCGENTRTHIIFNYKGENYLRTSNARAEKDEFTHLYTFILNADQSYEMYVDQVKAVSGTLYDHWDFLPPREIPDPEQSKPADWVDEEVIADPEDVKPAGWDDEPEFIVDPDAEKPEDWDDEDDGEWEAPMIENPEYKGVWYPNMIPNPEYKGEWEHPLIANPDFVDDPNIYAYDDFSWVGIDIWQVKSGTIFDNIIFTDNIEEAEAHAEKFWKPLVAGEKAMFEADKEAKKQAADDERAKRDAEIKAMEEEDLESDDDLVDADDADDRADKMEALKEGHDEL